MKKIFLFLLFISFSTSIFPQSSGDTKEFIYGTMIRVADPENYRTADTLVGYFWFDNQLDQNGQTVHFKKDLNATKTKKFQSRKYDYFVSDVIYLETFGAIPMLTGDVLIMIPRIIDGRIQLFDLRYRTESYYFIHSNVERFFIKKDNKKLRIKEKTFKKQMKELVGDDEALMKKIDSEELKYNDLIEIVTIYNSNHPN